MSSQTITNERTFWIGFLAVATVGSVVNIFHFKTFSLVIDLLLGVIFFMAISMMAGGVILLVGRIFTKKFNRLTFIKSSIIVCFVLVLSQLVDLFLT